MQYIENIIREHSKHLFTEQLNTNSYFDEWTKEALTKLKFYNLETLPVIKNILLLYLVLGSYLCLLGHMSTDNRLTSFVNDFEESLADKPFKQTMKKVLALALYIILSLLLLIAAIIFIPYTIYTKKILPPKIKNNTILNTLCLILSIPLGPIIFLCLPNQFSYDAWLEKNQINPSEIPEEVFRTICAFFTIIAEIILLPIFLAGSLAMEFFNATTNSQNSPISTTIFTLIKENLVFAAKVLLKIYIPLASISLLFGASFFVAPLYTVANLLLGNFLAISNQLFLVNYILVNGNFIFMWHLYYPDVLQQDFFVLSMIIFLYISIMPIYNSFMFILLSTLYQLAVPIITPKNHEDSDSKSVTEFMFEAVAACPNNITNDMTEEVTQCSI